MQKIHCGNKNEWDERLRTVFNRGFWDGYYLGQRLGEWNEEYGSSATEKKVYVGKGVKYFSKIGVAEFVLEAGDLHKGDKLCVTGPTTGIQFLTADEIRYDLKPVETAQKAHARVQRSPANMNVAVPLVQHSQ